MAPALRMTRSIKEKLQIFLAIFLVCYLLGGGMKAGERNASKQGRLRIPVSLEVVSYTERGLEFESELGVSLFLLSFCFELELTEQPRSTTWL
jgi:hypothetical protein